MLILYPSDYILFARQSSLTEFLLTNIIGIQNKKLPHRHTHNKDCRVRQHLQNPTDSLAQPSTYSQLAQRLQQGCGSEDSWVRNWSHWFPTVRPSASKKAPGLADVAATVGMWGRKFNLVVSSCKPVRWLTWSQQQHSKIRVRTRGCSSSDCRLL